MPSTAAVVFKACASAIRRGGPSGWEAYFWEYFSAACLMNATISDPRFIRPTILQGCSFSTHSWAQEQRLGRPINSASARSGATLTRLPWGPFA
jgi:hypothetical protein